MKQRILTFAAVCIAAMTFTACTKEVKEANQEEIDASTLSQIKSMGFSPEGVQKVSGGYIVEGDILLTEASFKENPSSPNLIIAEEEHYRTFNMVDPVKHKVIDVALSNSSSQHESAFSAALEEAMRRYNALGLSITFQRAAAGTTPDITVVAYYENSSTLGSAGFPTSSKDPYSQIKMNTYHYSTGTDATNINYIGTIMAHEIGHCIGFRHTDYMRRAYSCGYGGNEGQERNGVGAVHITGTPTGPDAASWMLACIGKGVNRPFNSNDVTALNYVY